MFTALNEDSRRGNFVFLTNKDRSDLDIDLKNHEIEIMSELSWKKLIKEQVNRAAFNYLKEENLKKEKTKDIKLVEN